MFGYDTEFEEENDFGTVSHLRDFADELGVDTTIAFGLSEDLESEQLASIGQELKAAIEEELARIADLAKRPACHIGPYADGICTICGGRQPGAG